MCVWTDKDVRLDRTPYPSPPRRLLLLNPSAQRVPSPGTYRCLRQAPAHQTFLFLFVRHFPTHTASVIGKQRAMHPKPTTLNVTMIDGFPYAHRRHGTEIISLRRIQDPGSWILLSSALWDLGQRLQFPAGMMTQG